ncbi:hypothetical protein BDV96DRAFT_585610 [Lophiotrema nucula]|uniref:Uncharacterized protein n=1 Tax=Lophiotrema nucula TaxID=690887 RepID=A0A6A5YSK8_9PLEO|nr:hypothetical protein BDV96DRAFT_585610 [Lophiotrema nucula]
MVLSQYGHNSHGEDIKVHPYPFLGSRQEVEHVNRYDRDGYTPLLSFVRIALAKQPPESEAFITSHITNLITLGANVNSRSRNGDSALHWAAQQRLPEVMECLIRAGANINATNDSGQRPIDYISQALQLELAGSATANILGQTLKCAVVLLDHDAESNISSQIEGSHGIRLEGRNGAKLTVARKASSS